MSGDTESSSACGAIVDDLAEMALGTLQGRRRSEVLDHVAACASCRAELDQLSKVTEVLQSLAPPMQPPLGFEMRLAERLRASSAPQRQRFPRAWVLAAAAAVVLVLALGVTVALVGRESSEASTVSGLTSADLTSQGKVIGSVLVSAENPGWMLVSTDGVPWTGPVRCEVTLVGGESHTIGTFSVSGGYSVWVAPLPEHTGRVQSARLIDSTGAVLATAQVQA
jgi:hypothetical protein